MKTLLSSCFSVLATSVFAAAPQVTVTGLSQDAASLQVTVTYSLDSDAIVTARVLTNGVAVAGKDLPFFVGDVSKPCARGTARSFTWSPERGLADVQLPGPVTVELTAWPESTPPDYLVVDLRNGERRYYPSEADLPCGGIADDIYRKELMVFRHIHAAGASFMMGAGTNEYGRINNVGNCCNEDYHEVRLTHDFWCAVFELTQYQCWRCTAYQCTSSFSNRTCWATRPLQDYGYDAMRGNKWPTDGFDGVGGVLATMRNRTGLRLDLLTEAQWEFACRAGTTTSLNGGLEVSVGATDGDSNTRVDPALSLLGRYAGNGGRGATVPGVDKDGKPTTLIDYTADDRFGTARVGSYRPNAWGLYDMHGNVSEFVLDWANWQDGNYGGLGSDLQVDPVGPTLAECQSHAGYVAARVAKGGCFAFAPRFCRSAAKRYQAGGRPEYGFRFAIQEQ